MANTRVKVSRTTLISKLQGEREKMVDRHEKALAKYADERKAFLLKLEQAVSDFYALLQSEPEKALDRVEENYSRGAYVRFPNVKIKTEPKLETNKLDRLIAVLESAEDETISIAADDDYARYL